jgi:chorismate dehydratase
MLRIGRIPYINCYPVYGAIDRGLVPLDGALVDGVPTALNARMASGELDVSVVSAVEYARDAQRYLLLPELAISCDGPVQSVMLFSRRPARELGGERVLVSRSSLTSVTLLELLFAHVWNVRPEFVPGDAEVADIGRFADEPHEARLVIGDAALRLHDAADQAGTMAHALSAPVRPRRGVEAVDGAAVRVCRVGGAAQHAGARQHGGPRVAARLA